MKPDYLNYASKYPDPLARAQRSGGYLGRWVAIEKRYGLPMRDVLLALHMEHGTWEAIADTLGTNVHAVKRWWRDSSLTEFGANDDGTVTIVICGDTDAHTQTGDPMTGVQQTEAGL